MSSVSVWPPGLTPESAPVYARNELQTSVPAETLWPVLLEVTEWPSWYPHAANVRVTEGEKILRLGSVFRWKTMGVTVTTTVMEFEPARSLAWKATSPVSRAFHRWYFAPADGGGCVISTEETESGLGPRLLASRLKGDLLRVHQDWLEQLVKRASEG